MLWELVKGIIGIAEIKVIHDDLKKISSKRRRRTKRKPKGLLTFTLEKR